MYQLAQVSYPYYRNENLRIRQSWHVVFNDKLHQKIQQLSFSYVAQ